MCAPPARLNRSQFIYLSPTGIGTPEILGQAILCHLCMQPKFVQHLPLGGLKGLSESKVGNVNAEGKVTIVGREGSYTKGSLKSPDSSDSSCRLVKGSVRKLTQILVCTYLLNDNHL